MFLCLLVCTGEELVLFSVKVSRLLSMAKQEQGTPPSVHYRALLSVIHLNYLREGSGIMAACRISPGQKGTGCHWIISCPDTSDNCNYTVQHNQH